MNPRALFLDRDGVINIDKGYVHRPADFEFVDGIFDLCRFFRDRNYSIIVITNQAGIARGYYSEADFLQLSEWMNFQFEKEGITISKTYYCPYHPEHGIGHYQTDSFNRKPNPGMILTARNDYELDLASSVLIGDKESDITAGLTAGIGTTILLTNASERILPMTGASFIVQSLAEVSQRLGYAATIERFDSF